MKAKKEVVAFTLLTITLVIAIGFAVRTVSGEKSKEVKVAKEFAIKLQDSNIIDTDINLEEVEFKSVDKLANKTSKAQYTVVAQNLGIDLDSEYAVIGFYQNSEETVARKLINEDNAIVIAEEYISQMTDEKFLFKEIKSIKEGEEKSSTYTIAFYKYFKEYPYYDNEIVVNINKDSGKLENYSNQSINKVRYNLKQNINEEEASDIAIDNFKKLNIEAKIVNKPLLAIAQRADGEFDLSYILDVDTINAEGKEEKYKMFINAGTSEVINRTTQLVETSVSN